jgi:hypothetical protein
LLKTFVSVAFAALLCIVPSVHGKSKRHNERPAASAVERPTTVKSMTDQPRDPADIALEKKIKSICRGC